MPHPPAAIAEAAPDDKQCVRDERVDLVRRMLDGLRADRQLKYSAAPRRYMATIAATSSTSWTSDSRA